MSDVEEDDPLQLLEKLPQEKLISYCTKLSVLAMDHAHFSAKLIERARHLQGAEWIQVNKLINENSGRRDRIQALLRYLGTLFPKRKES